ncbi:Mucin-21 [Xylographa trunciseda]|nr:Mucin-21 [Xylographa trunciseda]
MQTIPPAANAPRTFSNNASQLNAEPPDTGNIPSPTYGTRSVDLPFFRLFHGNLNFFSAGELNTPTGNVDVWESENDNANQSACGIPDNAYSASKVAIHPYFLRYASLSRYCMQDVCISFWKEDGSSDMMLKVTDICSTDPNDPTHCASPVDIKVERSKAMVMEGVTDRNDPRITGNSFPEQVWWFFTKCWDDGLAQPAYQNNSLWFTDPYLPNNLNWSISTASAQYKINQIAYPSHGWSTYPPGGYNTDRINNSPPVSDWVPGQEPAWSPIAGGVGWGQPKIGQTIQSDTSAAVAATIAISILRFVDHTTTTPTTDFNFNFNFFFVQIPSTQAAVLPTSENLSFQSSATTITTSRFTVSLASISQLPQTTIIAPSGPALVSSIPIPTSLFCVSVATITVTQNITETMTLTPTPSSAPSSEAIAGSAASNSTSIPTISSTDLPTQTVIVPAPTESLQTPFSSTVATQSGFSTHPCTGAITFFISGPSPSKSSGRAIALISSFTSSISPMSARDSTTLLPQQSVSSMSLSSPMPNPPMCRTCLLCLRKIVQVQDVAKKWWIARWLGERGGGGGIRRSMDGDKEG